MNAQLPATLAVREQQAIAAFATQLRNTYPQRISQLILFGSQARGDSHPESDIDILIIADSDDWRFRHAISDLASDVSLEYGVLIAPRLIAQARWDRMARAGYSLYRNVTREGVPLRA